jgi:septum formation protein
MIVLASTSPWRRELLGRLGLSFVVESPGVDETPAPGEDGRATARRLAREKALAVAARHPQALVIGSDQVCLAGERVLGKPGSVDAARAQLASLSGQQAVFVTALCVVDGAGRREFAGCVDTTVDFLDLDPARIARYVERERPLDCAGSFKVEGLGISLFESVRSDDPTALVGLPLILLCRFLRASGIEPLAAP